MADAPQAEPDPQAAPPTDASAAPEPQPEVANDVAPEPAIRPILVGSGGDAAAEARSAAGGGGKNGRPTVRKSLDGLAAVVRASVQVDPVAGGRPGGSRCATRWIASGGRRVWAAGPLPA